MIIIKYISLILILIISSYIGILISKKYQNRVRELKQIKSSLTVFAAKIKLTYEPIPKIFEELGKNQNLNLSENVSEIFKKASENMNNMPAGDAWNKALENQSTNLKKEDIEVLKNLSNLLGKVDLEGQVSEIELVDNFLDNQIEKAEEESKKNQRMYKTLGVTIGLAMVIIFV